MMPFNVGPWELLLILMVVLLVFGAKRLPEMGSSLGKGIREFKKSLTEVKESIESDEPSSGEGPRKLDGPPSDDGEPKKLSE